ncbi:MAG: cbb3-type cytochrome oxidase assembly protein CcoS [Chitinophagales bacterium]|nr:cbb3-type cytochrome oxidase assembly protein CcoS [Bacteroidota bacterium]MCB9044300.1 cbb3-type cytochrome oxidase assembly protein CcoS [Chitinophagales bacterium]
MSVIVILIVASLLVALIFLGAFLWAVRSGQYDDDYTPSLRIFHDETINKQHANKSSEHN